MVIAFFFCAGKQGYNIVEQSMAGTEGGGEGRRSSAPGECCCIPPFGGCLPHSFTHCLKFPFLVQGQSEDVAHLDLLMDVGSVCVPQLAATGALPHRRSREMAFGELPAVCFPGLWVRKESRQEKEMGNCLFSEQN